MPTDPQALVALDTDAGLLRNGRVDYERDAELRPLYPDGTKRKTWGQLDDVARWSWSRP